MSTVVVKNGSSKRTFYTKVLVGLLLVMVPLLGLLYMSFKGMVIPKVIEGVSYVVIGFGGGILTNVLTSGRERFVFEQNENYKSVMLVCSAEEEGICKELLGRLLEKR